MKSTGRFSAEVGAALLAFNEEAVLYCRSIVDDGAHEYAMDYARMLRGRAKGLELDRTCFSAHWFEPDQDLIEGTLDQMYRKYFATYCVASKLPLAVFGGLNEMQRLHSAQASRVIPSLSAIVGQSGTPARSVSDTDSVARPRTHPPCRKCGAIDTRGSHRRLLEKSLSWLILPFRCRVCRARFWKTRFALRQK